MKTIKLVFIAFVLFAVSPMTAQSDESSPNIVVDEIINNYFEQMVALGQK